MNEKGRYLFAALLVVFVVVLSSCAQKHVVYLPSWERVGAPLRLDLPTTKLYNEWKGVPYSWSGETKDGVDCSAFMQIVYQTLYRKQLPRTTSEQVHIGTAVRREEMRKGDLIFFKTGWGSRHVGMFLGGNYFLHSGEHTGVTISELDLSPTNNSDYWDNHFWCAKRP